MALQGFRIEKGSPEDTDDLTPYVVYFESELSVEYGIYRSFRGVATAIQHRRREWYAEPDALPAYIAIYRLTFPEMEFVSEDDITVTDKLNGVGL